MAMKQSKMILARSVSGTSLLFLCFSFARCSHEMLVLIDCLCVEGVHR